MNQYETNARGESVGPFTIEPESSLPGFSPGVFRIVSDKARDAMAAHGTTARPHYIATVYNHADAARVCRLLNEDDRR